MLTYRDGVGVSFRGKLQVGVRVMNDSYICCEERNDRSNNQESFLYYLNSQIYISLCLCAVLIKHTVDRQTDRQTLNTE